MSKQVKVFAGMATLTLGLGLTTAVLAQQSAPAKAANPDMKFVKHAVSGGLLEVKLGQIAMDQAANPAVKQFGQHMVQDHMRANQQLMNVLAASGIQAPKKIGQKDQECLDKLAKLRGGEFDKEYMKGMVKDHEKTIKLFQQEAEDGQNAQLKAFAQQTLPVLKAHLQMARQTCKQVEDGGSGR